MIKEDIILVSLTAKQIKKAKQINGERKKITHCLLCGSYGQIFGTEKHCRKYFSAWSKIFPNLFKASFERDDYHIEKFESTFDLVNILISHDDKLKNTLSEQSTLLKNTTTKKEGFFARLFS
ncbi:MAG: hypothetical protein GKR94_13550 [Gammaproteobacteria bacterium]|nr:hypothetical protein [Gammaproteobacteria bacterium]